MAGVGSTKTWVKFFTEAGIPDSAAATYALTFVDNRIQSDMLLELNKEYLKEMGITLMGDVIAILRQAKNVHEQQAREKVLSNSPKVSSATSKSDSPHGSEEDEIRPRKSSSGVRVNTNDHNIPRVTTSTSSSCHQQTRVVQPMSAGPVRVPEKKKRAIAQVICQPTNVHPYASDEEDIDLKDCYVPTSSMPAAVAKATSTVSTGSEELSPPKKAKVVVSRKKVTPEQISASKKTVFERLGEEKSNTLVASTTGPAASVIKKGSIMVTCNTASVNTNNTMEKKSVFSRLGSKTVEEEAECDTVKVAPKIFPEGPALPYAGVLKQTPSSSTTTTTITKKKIQKKIITMRADEPKVPVHLRAKSVKAAQTVMKKKVSPRSIPIIRRTVAPGVNKTVMVTNRTKTEGILGSNINASKVNVKQRLGMSQTVKQLPQKQIICFDEEETEDDYRTLNMDNIGNRFSADSPQTKKVTFGGVVQKSIPGRLSVNPPMKPVGRGSITMRTGVFSRLGMTSP